MENKLGTVLTVSIVLGLFVPGLQTLPKVIPLYIIASVIFVSCFKISRSEFSEVSLKRSASYYLLRFMVLPLGLFYLVNLFLPAYSSGVLLLSLMPVGIASPAVSGLLGGNVTVALSLVVLSSVLAPFVVPFAFYLTHDKALDVDLYQMFVLLSAVVFVPLLIHFPFRLVKPFNNFLNKRNRWLSVLLFGLLMGSVVGIQREQIFENAHEILEPLLVLATVYLVYYLFGFVCSSKCRWSEQVTFAICSGVNNNALGITLALSCLPDQALFMVLTVLPWAYGMVLFRLWARRGS